jgi:hypothetical protein
MQQQTLTDRQAEYAAYRQTPAWLGRRRLALEAAAHRCQVCNATGRLDVHHRTYERIFNELPGDLTVLCRDCHATFHGKQGAAALSKPKPARPKGKRKKSKGHARATQRNKAWHWQIPTFLTTVPGASTADVALRFSVDPGQASDRLIALSVTCSGVGHPSLSACVRARTG